MARSTPPMLADELSQGKVAAQIYTDYFGPLPFPQIALTQQFSVQLRPKLAHAGLSANLRILRLDAASIFSASRS